MNCIKNRTILFAVIIIFFCFGYIYASSSISFTIDKTELFIGDDLNLQYVVSLPESCKIIKPEYDFIKNWYIKDISLNQNNSVLGVNVYNINIVLTTFNPAQKQIPEVTFFYNDGNNKKCSINAKPIEVTIKSALSDSSDAADLKDIKSVKKLYIYSYYYYILIGFLIYFVLVYILYLKNINIKKILLLLEKIKLNEKQKSIEVRYNLMCKMINRFIKLQYNINAENLKKQEMAYQLSVKHLNKDVVNIFIKILDKEYVDINKYSEKDINNDITNVINIINNILKRRKYAEGE